MSDRIKLAEAMGWRYQKGKSGRDGMPTVPVGWVSPHDGTLRDNPPDPFTDANDDYAVLEWAISNVQEDRWTLKQWDAFKDYWREVTADWNVWNYRIGDYARAALKVISDG